MALSEIQQAEVNQRLRAFCHARVPPHVRHQVRLGYRIQATAAVLFEERPAFRPPHEWRELAIAKFRYVGTQKLWRLYCQHRDLRWHSYEALPAAPSFKRLLDEVAADPTGIFWG
jgi:hypothetical protein